MKDSLRHQALLIVVCAVTFLVNLGATHLWEEDEAYFGRTATEMEQRGDYVVPFFNGEPSLHKPAFMYWVMIAGMRVFGVNEFALRFGSVIFSIGNVLLTYHLGRMLFSARVGFWSAFVLATSLHFVIVARAAVADPELIFFCTLPLLIFVHRTSLSQHGLETETSLIRATDLSWRDWALVYASMGVAALVKGPVGIVLPTAVMGLFLLLSRADSVTSAVISSEPPEHWLIRGCRWFLRAFWPTTILRTAWEMRPLTGLMMIAIIAGPWYTLVGLRTNGEWLRGFFFVHNYGRFVNSFESHDGGPLYYLVAICIGTCPWCIFGYHGVRQAIYGLRSESLSRPAYQLLCSWVAVWVGAFTLAGTKLPHYVLPAYPAIALMLGHFIEQWQSGVVENSRGWMRASWATLILIGLGLFVAVPFVTRHYLPGEEHLALIGIAPLLGGLVGLWADEVRRRTLAAATVVVTAVVFSVALLGWAAVRVDKHQKSPVVASWLRELKPHDATVVGAFGCFEASLLYYCDRNIERLRTKDAALEFFSHSSEAFLITTDHRLSDIESQLPSGIVVLRETPRFLKSGKLLLLGRLSRPVALSPDPQIVSSVPSDPKSLE